MKTTKEMIEIMLAYERGEQIEYAHIGSEAWKEIKEPSWNWLGCDYRIKQKPKYMPFETAEEFLEAQRVHGVNVSFQEIEYGAHINSNGVVLLISHNNSLKCIFTDLENLFTGYEFADGTPCGKEELL